MKGPDRPAVTSHRPDPDAGTVFRETPAIGSCRCPHFTTSGPGPPAAGDPTAPRPPVTNGVDTCH